MFAVGKRRGSPMRCEIHLTAVLRDVRVSDMLSIHTRNSVYEFFMIDPVRAYGLVRGGAIGTSALEAFICMPLTLGPGLRVRLLIESASGVRYVTTSTVRTIKCLRSD